MAYQDTHSFHLTSAPNRLLGAVKSAFALVGQAMVAAAGANRRFQTVERLNEKSDAELAEMGIRREDIVRRVFIDMLDV